MSKIYNAISVLIVAYLLFDLIATGNGRPWPGDAFARAASVDDVRTFFHIAIAQEFEFDFFHFVYCVRFPY